MFECGHLAFLHWPVVCHGDIFLDGAYAFDEDFGECFDEVFEFLAGKQVFQKKILAPHKNMSTILAEMIHINPQIIPSHPDGWHFPTGRAVIKASTYRELLVKVTEYKISARQDFQNVQEEVNGYLAGVSPGNVHSRHPSTPNGEAPVAQVTPTAGRVYAWLSGVHKKIHPSMKFATQVDANARAYQCINCPWNVRDDVSCSSCASQMKMMAQAILRGRRTSSDTMVKACGALGMKISVAAHLEDDILGDKSEDPKLPGYCWRKKKDQGK